MNDILTPNILHSIIICSTIVILSVIAVSAYRIRKVENRKAALGVDKVKDGYVLGSYIFLSSIVVLIGIVIFSYSFYADKTVLDFMSLASALVSIILAVITIIYSFVINSQTTGQIDELCTTSKNLHQISEKVESASFSVIRATESYSKSARSLEDNITIIIDQLNTVAKAIESVDEYELNTAVNRIDSTPSSSGNNEIDEFFKNCPSAGLMMVYACIKAEKAGKILYLKKVFDLEMILYYVGFLASLQSLGYVKAELDVDRMVVKNIRVRDSIKELIPQIILKRKDNVFVRELYEKIDRIYKTRRLK